MMIIDRRITWQGIHQNYSQGHDEMDQVWLELSGLIFLWIELHFFDITTHSFPSNQFPDELVEWTTWKNFLFTLLLGWKSSLILLNMAWLLYLPFPFKLFTFLHRNWKVTRDFLDGSVNLKNQGLECFIWLITYIPWFPCRVRILLC